MVQGSGVHDHEPGPADALRQVVDDISGSDVTRALVAHGGELRACVSSRTNVRVQAEVTPAGVMDPAVIAEPPLDACLTTALAKIPLPATKRGGHLDVVIDFP